MQKVLDFSILGLMVVLEDDLAPAEAQLSILCLGDLWVLLAQLVHIPWGRSCSSVLQSSGAWDLRAQVPRGAMGTWQPEQAGSTASCHISPDVAWVEDIFSKAMATEPNSVHPPFALGGNLI